MKKSLNFQLFSFFYNFGLSLFQPFLNLYAYYLKFPKEIIGVLNGISEITNNLSKLLAGYVYFLVKRKSFILLLNIIFYSILLYSFSFAKNFSLFTFLIIIKAILDSFFVVGYSIILANLFRGMGEIRDISLTNLFSSLGSMIGSIITGLITLFYDFHQFLFLFSSFLLFLSSIFLLPLKIDVKYVKTKKKRKKEFINFLMIYSLFLFSVGIASPYFSIFLVEILKLKPIHWSIIIVIEILSILAFSYEIQKTIKKFGYVKSFVSSSFLISFIPLVWVLSKKFEIILFWSIISGVAWYIFNTTTLTYLTNLFSTKTEVRASIFYLVSGIVLSLGYFTGSFLVKISLTLVFYISFIMRALSSILFFFVKEGLTKQSFHFLNRYIVSSPIISISFFYFLFKQKLKEIKI